MPRIRSELTGLVLMLLAACAGRVGSFAPLPDGGSDSGPMDAGPGDAGSVNPSGGLSITTTTIPGATVGVAYSTPATAAGGAPPYRWSIVTGLPAGITIDPNTGTLSGTPTAGGSFVFDLVVTDSSGTPARATARLALFVTAAGPGIPLTACGTLATAGATYTLRNDVAAPGTCFSVTADGITLDLAGHKVTYGTTSQPAHLVAGIMMVACYEDAWTGGTINSASGSACGSFARFAVHGGTVDQGEGTLMAGSHVIRAGGNGSLSEGPTVFGVNATWSADSSQFLSTDYGNSRVPGGAVLHDNTLTNQTAAACADVGCRDQLQGSSIRISNAVATTTPALLYANHITGGPQGALECDAPGCTVHDNFLDPGTSAIGYSNDFAIYCWSSCDVYRNTILTPLSAAGQGRGIEISGVETSTVGALVHENVITVTENPNNEEYSGCEIGGAYGIQFDDNGTGGVAASNVVTAIADRCAGTGLRLTDTESMSNISHDNTYSAVRSAASPACGFIGGGTGEGCAHAAVLAGPSGFLSERDSFQGDSDVLNFDWDGASNVTFIAPTLLKGTTHPSANFHTFVFRNGGAPVSNIHVQDAVFGAGTSATDLDLPARGGNNLAASMFIDWSQTTVVTTATGQPLSGARVAFRDALGATFMATTDASGKAVVVVPQYRMNNDHGADGMELHTPYSRTITATGCTTGTATGLPVTAPATTTVALTGC